MKSDHWVPKLFITFFWLYLFSIPVKKCANEFSIEEQDALKNFRPLVENIVYRDYMKKDYFLIRWLRARDLDISKARSMLKKAIRWRRENKIDTILNETIPITFPVMPYYDDGLSYAANPVCTVNTGAFEMKKWIMAGKSAELLRAMIQATEIGEAGIQYMAAIIPSIRQIIVIFDWSGYTQRQHGCFACILLFQEWVRIYENYYPQLYKYAIYVNTPRIFKRVLSAVKPLLSPHSQNGLMVYGQNKKEWRNELFKIVPRNQLRRGLGGTKPDNIPCAIQDFVCLCKIFLKSAGQGTNTTVTLSSGLLRLDESIC